MAARSPALPRAALALLLLGLLAAGLRYGRAAASGELARYQDVLNFARGLATRGAFLTAEESTTLSELVLRLQIAVNYWTAFPDKDSPIAGQAQRDCAAAMSQVVHFLEASTATERVWIGTGAPPSTIVRQWPTGSGVVLLRIGRAGVQDANPRFVRAQYDLAQHPDVAVDLSGAGTVYAALFFSNAVEGATRIPIHLRAGASEIGAMQLAVTTPPTGTLEVRIVDDTGKPTPAAAAIFASNDELLVPTAAIAFDQGGFYYQPGRVRPHVQSHYWPGKPARQRAFFVNGEFSLRVPAGAYQLVASKGPEYVPLEESISVKAGATTRRDFRLRRWTNMPARGWYSGDGHVHYARADEEANRRLSIWTQAEDIHVASVLRMGDASETYFEQYGFGKEGRYVTGNYALVPGQEDPRTNFIGHTMQLNLQRPIHLPDRYYFYDQVFDETRRQGGVTGYAHLVQPSGAAFFVRRDMAMNVPAGRVDFAEICEFGDIGQDLYYEFLNLGFPLTASAGSDVPWGNTVGTSRVYAYTGDRFTPDAWFDALKAGHTFVTTGAMLEFTVNGQIAGSVIEARAGDVLHIKASASGGPVKPRYLEIVAQGEVIRNTSAAELSFDLPVRSSTWIAARCFGAHTTPVYIKVGGERFWKRDAVEPLVAHRLAALQELDDLTRQEIPASHQGNWDSPAVWKASAAALRERTKIARETYARLIEESRR